MRRLARPLAGALILACSLTAPGAAQQPERRPTTGSITGVVLDASRNVGVAGAMVVIDGTNRGTLSDSLGIFELEDVPAGEELLYVRQYGYWEVGALVNVTAGEALVLEVALIPDPEVLDGITVVAERLATMQRRLTSRRNAAPVSTRAFEQERLFRTAALDVRDFLQMEAFLQLSPCDGGSVFGDCVRRRGRTIAPNVYIDESPAVGGLDQLALYSPRDLYLLEVYSSGAEIRAYTHQFMDLMARRPMMLIPVFLP